MDVQATRSNPNPLRPQKICYRRPKHVTFRHAVSANKKFEFRLLRHYDHTMRKKT